MTTKPKRKTNTMPVTRDLDDQVTDLFPLDGPYSPDRTTAAARSIAELVRYLNHATPPWKSGDALKYPSHLGTVVSNLHAAVCGMQQLLGQLAYHADRFGAVDGLYDDHGQDPTLTVQAVAANLHEAVGALDAAATKLRLAHGPANRLGIRE